MYYPLFKVPNLECSVTLLNSAPNDWETEATAVVVHQAIIHGDSWSVNRIKSLAVGESLRVSSTDELANCRDGTLALLFPQETDVSGTYAELPAVNLWRTALPMWRASICLGRGSARACYQGDIEPFRLGGTALSFHPFIQPKPFTNSFLGINFESAPNLRAAKVNISKALDGELIATHSVTNNSAFLIDLDQYGFSQVDLPVIWSTDLSMVPSGLGWNPVSGEMSWEHTHPPASMTVFGDRWGCQTAVKRDWFAVLSGRGADAP